MQNNLKITDLVVSVDDKQVLNGINLSINGGELHVVMGPNGAGKSSLANTLVGNERYVVNNGGVLLNDNDLLSLSISQRANSGLFLAFQNPVEVEGVSVQNFLRLAHKARFKNNKDRSFAKALDFRKYLKDLAKNFAIKEELLLRNLNEGFSGGEKKQLEMLQLVLLEPKIAIIDEIDSGLDIDAVKKVASMIKYMMKGYGTGVVLITHYQRVLDYLPLQMVHILVNGQIAVSGGSELITQIEDNGYLSFVD